MHVIKFKATNTGGVINHDKRIGSNHTNEDIDPTRSHLNYNLASGDAALKLKKRLSEVKVLNRADVNVMCSWAITQPQELGKGCENVDPHFFELMYQFMADRYGEENIVSAYVHLDEVQPHMHFKFVPVIEGRVSANDVLTRSELRVIHKEADKIIEQHYGRSGLINNGKTTQNKTVAELKKETRLKDLDKKLKLTEAQLSSVIEEYNADVGDFNALIEEKEQLQREIPILERKARERAKNEPLWAKMVKVYDDLTSDLTLNGIFEAIHAVLDKYLYCRNELGWDRLDSFNEAIEEVANQTNDYFER